MDSRCVSIVTIEKGPTWFAVGSAHAVKLEEISYRGNNQSSLDAYYSQVDLLMDSVACIDETTAIISTVGMAVGH